jgi:hypothetical protein
MQEKSKTHGTTQFERTKEEHLGEGGTNARTERVKQAKRFDERIPRQDAARKNTNRCTAEPRTNDLWRNGVRTPRASTRGLKRQSMTRSG